MIDLIMYLGMEVVMIRVIGKQVLFMSNSTYNSLIPIDSLKFSRDGVIKEFPDLADNEAWQEIALKRFKDHINSKKNEEEVADYVAEDLKKQGYVLKVKQRSGFRPKNFN